MHALLVTAGSSGDVFPFIAIGLALQARGHRATVLVNPAFEKAVTEAGVGYRALGNEPFDFSQLMQIKDSMHPSRGSLTVLREFVLPNVPTIVRETRAAIDGDGVDAVVAHHIAFGAGWAAQERGVALAKVVLAPMAWFNPREPSVFNHWGPRNPGALVMRTQLFLGRMLVRFQFDPHLNAQRKIIGYGPARDMAFTENETGDRVLGMWSPAFRGPLAGDPAQSVVCGFPTFDRPAHPERDGGRLEGFLDECDRAKDAPIVFSLGTAVVHGAGRYFHAAAEACRLLSRRGVLISGRPEFLPAQSDCPPGVHCCTYAPYSTVFPRGAVNVHHGGIGTTAQGLRAGRPTVITPVAYDQFDHAARCERLGVSRTVHFAKATPARLAAALRSVLGDPQVAARAKAIAGRMAGEDGAERAADEVEAMVAERPRGRVGHR